MIQLTDKDFKITITSYVTENDQRKASQKAPAFVLEPVLD